MAHVKIVLRKKPNSEGKMPLCLRITKDRKASFIHLGYHLSPEDWDDDKQRVKKSHANSVRLNNFLLKKLSEANDHALELETQKNQVSSQSVKQKIRPTTKSTFFAQADFYLARLKKAGKYNQYTADKPRIKHFKEFLKQDIAFHEISVGLLERFKEAIKAEFKLSERSAVNHLVVIRSIFSQAIKEGITDSKHYPFGKGNVKIKFPDSSKIGLSEEEIKVLETVTLVGAPHHARNLWLFSFYLAGMRVSDVLRIRWSDFQDDRLYYEMGKNSKGGSLKVSEKVLNIIAQYAKDKRSKDDFIFPELKSADIDNQFTFQRTIAFKTSAIDKCLKTH